jgi:hypothetical protein
MVFGACSRRLSHEQADNAGADTLTEVANSHEAKEYLSLASCPLLVSERILGELS